MAEFSSLSLLPSPQEPSLSLHLILGRQTTLSSFMEPKFSQLGVKIAASTVKNSSGKGVKRKAPETTSSRAKMPRTLQSFFNPSTSGQSTLTSERTESDRGVEPTTENELAAQPPSSSSSSSFLSSSQLKPEWSSLFSGPPKPPLCKKHAEPTILRTVRKAGPTKGRQFWVCSRPAGSQSDPNTQCDFFQWLSSSAPRKVT